MIGSIIIKWLFNTAKKSINTIKYVNLFPFSIPKKKKIKTGSMASAKSENSGFSPIMKSADTTNKETEIIRMDANILSEIRRK